MPQTAAYWAYASVLSPHGANISAPSHPLFTSFASGARATAKFATSPSLSLCSGQREKEALIRSAPPIFSSLNFLLREHGSGVRAGAYELILVFAYFWFWLSFFNKWPRQVMRRRQLSGCMFACLILSTQPCHAVGSSCTQFFSWLIVLAHHFHRILWYRLHTTTTTCGNRFNTSSVGAG